MSASEIFSRPLLYYKRHGLRSTMARVATFLRQAPATRQVLFYYDLAALPAEVNPREQLRFARKVRPEDIDSGDWQRMMTFWNPRVSQRNFSDRFRAGASLWLVWFEGQLAGYGWTLTGSTIAPHYHPLGMNDVHMFDFLVFPEYRGRQVNPALVNHILQQMAAEGRSRAYIEVKEWNRPQLNSLAKTGFRRLGVARKLIFFGRPFVQWSVPPTTSWSVDAQSPAGSPAGENTGPYISPVRR